MIRQTLFNFKQSEHLLMDKAEFLAKVSATHRDFEETLGKLDENELLIPGSCGEWSVKDIIAHVTWYEKQMVGIIKTRNFSGSDLWNLSNEERNKVIYSENRDRQLDEIKTEARDVYKTLIELLSILDEDELQNAGMFINMPSDWIPWEVIASNTCDHYPDHTADIQEAFPQSSR